MKGSGVTRAQAQAFFEGWLRQHRTEAWHARGAESLHNDLLDATVVDADSVRPAQRQLAITTHAIPVVYSHKCAPLRASPRFRLLAEPGGIDLGVAEQVRLSRALLRRFCDDMHWPHAYQQVDRVLGILLPADPQEFLEWHGGLGFGLEVGEDGPDLRLYCNVRHGTFASRWQRFADAIGEFADDTAKPVFLDLLDRAAPRTAPAGLALAIARDEVHAVRLYCGLLEATADSAIAAAPAPFVGSAVEIQRFVCSHEEVFGELGEQDMTLAYDFAVRTGLLRPAVARYKVDIRCAQANAAGRVPVAAWVDEVVTSLGMDVTSLREFVAGVAETFGGCTYQYVSLGCREKPIELTAYCIPGVL